MITILIYSGILLWMLIGLFLLLILFVIGQELFRAGWHTTLAARRAWDRGHAEDIGLRKFAREIWRHFSKEAFCTPYDRKTGTGWTVHYFPWRDPYESEKAD